MSEAEGPNGHTSGTEASRWGIEALALGISLGGPGTPDDWRSALELVDAAEALGLHSVWMPEMHFAPGVTPSPLVCLAAIAQRTQTLRLATTSLLLPIHDPVQIAREVTAIDHLSQGRIIVGLGRGFRAPLFAAFGIDPATKRDRFDQALDEMLGLWAGGEAVLPVQRPHPPLAVAAFGRKGLAQAARRGLPYLASPVEPFELIRENLEFHRDNMPGSAPEGRVVPIMRTVFVSDEPAQVERVKQGLEAENRAPRGGAKLPSALARAVAAPIEDRVVVGPASEVADRLARYREELGMNLLVARPQVSGVPRAAMQDSLGRLAEEILPAIAR